VLAMLVCAIGLVAPHSAALQAADLFNGKDLTGWTAVFDDAKAEAAGTWSAKDGSLFCTGQPAGYLRTKKDDYQNYVLSLEWRWPEGAKGGNNGVLVHCSTPHVLGVWPRSVEVQLASGEAGDFWVIPEAVTIAIPDQAARQQGRRHRNLTDGSEKPIGQWNTMEITCKGDTITVKVNGTLVNEATKSSETRGAIALQSEGAPIEFRKIQIREIK
jgi:hypothetical protein